MASRTPSSAHWVASSDNIRRLPHHVSHVLPSSPVSGQDAERQHREVVSIYRTHLLSAAQVTNQQRGKKTFGFIGGRTPPLSHAVFLSQGHMDEDVQAALLQIIRMRQEFVC